MTFLRISSSLTVSPAGPGRKPGRNIAGAPWCSWLGQPVFHSLSARWLAGVERRGELHDSFHCFEWSQVQHRVRTHHLGWATLPPLTIQWWHGEISTACCNLILWVSIGWSLLHYKYMISMNDDWITTFSYCLCSVSHFFIHWTQSPQALIFRTLHKTVYSMQCVWYDMIWHKYWPFNIQIRPNLFIRFNLRHLESPWRKSVEIIGSLWSVWSVNIETDNVITEKQSLLRLRSLI